MAGEAPSYRLAARPQQGLWGVAVVPATEHVEELPIAQRALHQVRILQHRATMFATTFFGSNLKPGWGIMALLVAVFPANVHMALEADQWLPVPAWALWGRLPLQLGFAWWAWATCIARRA